MLVAGMAWLFHEEGNPMPSAGRPRSNYALHRALSTQTLIPPGRFYQRLVEGLLLRPEDVMVTNSVLCAKAGFGQDPVRAHKKDVLATPPHNDRKS